MYDEDDDSLFDDDREEVKMKVEDFFNIVTIDKKRKKRITIRLEDADGDEVPIKEAVEKLTDYVIEKASNQDDDDNNHVINKLAPLVGHALVCGLPKVIGDNLTIMMLSMEHYRHSMSMMMLLSFVLIKWVQDKKLKIVTMEEDISDEDLEKQEKIHKANSAAMISAMLGMTPEEAIKEIAKSGDVNLDDVLDDKDEEDDETEE